MYSAFLCFHPRTCDYSVGMPGVCWWCKFSADQWEAESCEVPRRTICALMSKRIRRNRWRFNFCLYVHTSGTYRGLLITILSWTWMSCSRLIPPLLAVASCCHHQWHQPITSSHNNGLHQFGQVLCTSTTNCFILQLWWDMLAVHLQPENESWQ